MTAGDGASGGGADSEATGREAASEATWASLFDRAADYDVDVADVRAALDERRGDGDDSPGADSGSGGTSSDE